MKKALQRYKELYWIIAEGLDRVQTLLKFNAIDRSTVSGFPSSKIGGNVFYMAKFSFVVGLLLVNRNITCSVSSIL